MSFSHSFIATRLPVDRFRDAMLASWPDLELVEAATGFTTPAQVWAWASSRSGYLKGARSDDVKLIYRDGDWSVLLDISLCMTSDEEELRALSRRAGRVLAGATQGTAGVADFGVYDDGRLVRRILGEDGDITEEGAPLEQEGGIDLHAFYLDEIDALWQRFGLRSLLEEPVFEDCLALQMRDAADARYWSEREKAAGAPRRPWWRFW